jgi:hypothetical protein
MGREMGPRFRGDDSGGGCRNEPPTPIPPHEAEWRRGGRLVIHAEGVRLVVGVHVGGAMSNCGGASPGR